MGKKKKKISLSKLLYFVSAILGVVSICMIFLTSMNVKGSVFGLSGTTEYSGFNTVFGYKVDDTEYLKFSILNLLPFIFVLVASVISLAKAFGKMDSGLTGFIALGLFVAGGVLFLFNTQFTIFAENYANAIKTANILTTVVTKSLGIGAIVSACCSFVAGVSILLPRFVK